MDTFYLQPDAVHTDARTGGVGLHVNVASIVDSADGQSVVVSVPTAGGRIATLTVPHSSFRPTGAGEGMITVPAANIRPGHNGTIAVDMPSVAIKERFYNIRSGFSDAKGVDELDKPAGEPNYCTHFKEDTEYEITQTE